MRLWDVKEISKEQFEAMSPYWRGYAVYFFGCNDAFPNVPDEPNKFVEGTEDWKDWNRGNNDAMYDVMDLED